MGPGEQVAIAVAVLGAGFKTAHWIIRKIKKCRKKKKVKVEDVSEDSE